MVDRVLLASRLPKREQPKAERSEIPISFGQSGIHREPPEFVIYLFRHTVICVSCVVSHPR